MAQGKITAKQQEILSDRQITRALKIIMNTFKPYKNCQDMNTDRPLLTEQLIQMLWVGLFPG